MIAIKNVSFSYNKQNDVLKDFSLSFKEGGIYGLLGKNGSGKSTLLYLMSGLLQPTKGEVLYNGIETKLRLPEVQQDFFIVPEEYDLPALPLQEYVETLKPFYPNFSEETLEKCLEGFEMKKDMNLGALSMGQKKKVYMCIALAANTKVLLMDEPTNGLDILSKSQFRKVVVTGMSEDKIIIISTHQVHDVEHILDHVTIIDENSVLYNAPLQEEEMAIDLEKLFIEKNLNPTPVTIDIDDLEEATTIEFTKRSTWENLKNFAKWDITINRSFYIKCFAVVFVLLFFPFLTSLAGIITTLPNGNMVDRWLPYQTFDFSSFFMLLPILIGFTFHNLRNRQSRLNEFTLPVSNRIKFIWHACFTIVGSWLAVVVTSMVLDIMQMILVCLTSGWEYVESLTLRHLTDIPEAIEFARMYPDMLFIIPLTASAYIAFCSTFLLGNALKYKSNIMLTIGFHFAFVFSVLFLCILTLLSLNGRWFGRFFYEDVPGAIISCIVFACITVFCWWKSYRLYRNGQITTARNK